MIYFFRKTNTILSKPSQKLKKCQDFIGQFNQTTQNERKRKRKSIPGLVLPKRTSARAAPPAWPGYPTQTIAEMRGSFLAKETSIGPPDINTSTVGPLEAMATCDTSSCCRPGKRMCTLSLNSASMDWSNPITSTVASACFAAAAAAANCRSSLHATPEQPAW